MKKYLFIPAMVTTIALQFFCGTEIAANNPVDSMWVLHWESLETNSAIRIHFLQNRLSLIHSQLQDVTADIREMDLKATAGEQQLRILIRQQQLLSEQVSLQSTLNIQQSIVRYRKGLELIKLLYEKVLALDHHFTSLQTQHHIAALCNPNSFEEFKDAKVRLQQKTRKEYSLEMPPVLQANPYFAAAFMLVSSFVSIGDSKQKEKELEDISCILDFTMQMQSDLNIVYFETQYLNEGNQVLREECAALFAEYVKPLAYYTALDVCRKQDDWEAVSAAVDRYMKIMEMTVAAPDEGAQKSAYKYQVDLDFAIDRLLDYINKYESFVSQGLKYYHKFQVIVNSYANESVCSQRLPLQFANLKTEIGISIEKFDASYSLPEIKGSRLKDLLYGVN